MSYILYRACRNSEVDELKKKGNYSMTSTFSKYMRDAVKFDLSKENKEVRGAVENLRESIVEGRGIDEIELERKELFETLDNLGQYTNSDFLDKVKGDIQIRVDAAVYASQSGSDSNKRNAAKHIMPSNSFTSFPIDWRINNSEKAYGFTPEKSIAQNHMKNYNHEVILTISIPKDHVISDISKVQYDKRGELDYNGVPFNQCVIDFNSNEGYQKTRYKTTEREVAALFDLRPDLRAPLKILEVTKYD